MIQYQSAIPELRSYTMTCKFESHIYALYCITRKKISEKFTRFSRHIGQTFSPLNFFRRRTITKLWVVQAMGHFFTLTYCESAKLPGVSTIVMQAPCTTPSPSRGTPTPFSHVEKMEQSGAKMSILSFSCQGLFLNKNYYVVRNGGRARSRNTWKLTLILY